MNARSKGLLNNIVFKVHSVKKAAARSKTV